MNEHLKTDWIEARICALTKYRPSYQEMQAVRTLLNAVDIAFESCAATGDDPATHFIPILVVPENIFHHRVE